MIYVYCILLLSISGTNKRRGQFFCCRLIQLQHSSLSQFHGVCYLPSLLSLTVSFLCVADIGREKEKQVEEQPGPIFYFLSSLPLLPPATTAGFWVLPVISLLLTNTVSPLRACLCLIIWWERFRGTQKEDGVICVYLVTIHREDFTEYKGSAGIRIFFQQK